MTDESRPDRERLLGAILDDSLDGDLPTFEAPWQARAFGLAVTLQDHEDRDWEAFNQRFVERLDAVDPESMQADVEGVYYERWLESLEALLLEEELITEEELLEREAEFSEGDRDAAEFVVDP